MTPPPFPPEFVSRASTQLLAETIIVFFFFSCPAFFTQNPTPPRGVCACPEQVIRDEIWLKCARTCFSSSLFELMEDLCCFFFTSAKTKRMSLTTSNPFYQHFPPSDHTMWCEEGSRRCPSVYCPCVYFMWVLWLLKNDGGSRSLFDQLEDYRVEPSQPENSQVGLRRSTPG